MGLMLQIKNPCLDTLVYNDVLDDFLDPIYPCIKHKIAADPELDGTDYFIAAESILWESIPFDAWNEERKLMNCSLSFTCENDKKAFYKLIKDC